MALTGRLLGSALAGFAVSCAGTPTGAPTEPLPRPSAVGPTVPSASSAPSAGASAALPPPAPSGSAGAGADVPAEPPPTAAEIAAMIAELPADERAKLPLLERFCRVAVGRYPADWDPPTGGSVAVGCSCCAPFEQCPPVPGAPPIAVPTAQDLYGMRHATRGSFSGPGKKEIAVTLWGCEPGAGNRGGTALFEEAAGPLRLVAYHAAANPDGCDPLRAADGHDLLVCQLTDGQGSTGYTSLFVFDLASVTPDGGGYDEFETLPLDGVCLLDEGMRYAVTKLEKHSLRDLDGDGRKDLVLEVDHQGGVVSAADLASCRAATDFTLFPPTLAKPVRYRFEYQFDGKTLRPRPATKALQHKLYDAHTKFWAALRGS